MAREKKAHKESKSTKERESKKGDVVRISLDKNILEGMKIVAALFIGLVIGSLASSYYADERIGEEIIKDRVVSTIQDIVSAQYGGAITPNVVVKEIRDEGSYYVVSFTINNQPGEVYVSYDGKKMFFQALDLKEGSAEAKEPERVDVSVDDDPYLGSDDAPVVIVEFSDFQCPFCKKFHDETFSKLKEEYIDTGKVKFVYRDFPLNFHQNAFITAMAAECADDQGKFWEYADMLFKRQSEWEGLGEEEIVDKLVEYASSLGLNVDEFRDCLESEKYRDEVQKDLEDGQRYGVSGTPAFFINGIKLSGALPYEVFKQVIEEELSRVGA